MARKREKEEKEKEKKEEEERRIAEERKTLDIFLCTYIHTYIYILCSYNFIQNKDK